LGTENIVPAINPEEFLVTSTSLPPTLHLEEEQIEILESVDEDEMSLSVRGHTVPVQPVYTELTAVVNS
jgi:hypothetical protein